MVNIISYLVLILAVVFVFLQYREADKLDCSMGGMDLPVIVHLNMPDPKLNTDLSYSEITRKFRAYHRGKPTEAFQQALGVTEFSLGVKFELKFAEKMKTLAGQVCLVPQSIDVFVNLDQTIFLGNPSTRSKCKYRTLMEHEMKHVKINRDVNLKNLKQYEDSVKEGILAFGENQGWGPYPTSQSDAKKKALTEYMSASVNRVVKTNEAEMNRLQRKVDSPREYQRIGRACRW